MISQIVSSMLSMPPRESRRSMSAIPESIEKPFAIAIQTALTDSITTLPSPGTKSATTRGWRKAASAPVNSAEAIRAREAGTLRMER